MNRRRAVVLIGIAALLALVPVTLAVSAARQSSWELEGRTRWPMRGEFLIRPGGRKLRVWCQGEGAPGVVLEATGLAGADQYEALISRLSPKVRVCAYDRAGMGYSEPLPKPTTPGILTGDLLGVALLAGPPPWVLVAGSLGAVPVLLMARERPGQIAGLVLLDAAVPEAFEPLEPARSKLESSTRWAALMSRWGLLRHADPLKLGDTRDAWLTYRESTWRATHDFLETRHAALQRLALFPPPPADLPLRMVRHTRVGDLLGPRFSLEEHQQFEPAWQQAQEQFAAGWTRGKLIAAPDAGHLIVVDAPDVAEQAVREVIALAAPPAAAP